MVLHEFTNFVVVRIYFCVYYFSNYGVIKLIQVQLTNIIFYNSLSRIGAYVISS
jgi:hypothetical protein